jgi:phosphoenolpyruvate synthase/pyruvate phosphate dikinase
VYAGVMIQVGVDASAAGVLITTNIYDRDDDTSYTINAKRGLGIRVVEGTRIPEQIIYDTSNQGTRILSRSDDPVMLVFDERGGTREVPNENRGVILTEDRARRLAETVQKFLPLFPGDQPQDVEWLYQGDEVWIVQSRPFVGE